MGFLREGVRTDTCLNGSPPRPIRLQAQVWAGYLFKERTLSSSRLRTTLRKILLVLNFHETFNIHCFNLPN